MEGFLHKLLLLKRRSPDESQGALAQATAGTREDRP